MNKPLSETHPTIAKKYYVYALDGVEEKYYDAEAIQSCTVDVVEHERVIAEKQEELEKLQHSYYERNAEIERLKKELDEIMNMPITLLEYEKGIVEGERRASAFSAALKEFKAFEERVARAEAYREAWAFVRQSAAHHIEGLFDEEEAWAMAEAEFVRVFPRFLRLARLTRSFGEGAEEKQ